MTSRLQKVHDYCARFEVASYCAFAVVPAVDLTFLASVASLCEPILLAISVSLVILASHVILVFQVILASQVILAPQVTIRLKNTNIKYL